MFRSIVTGIASIVLYGLAADLTIIEKAGADWPGLNALIALTWVGAYGFWLIAFTYAIGTAITIALEKPNAKARAAAQTPAQAQPQLATPHSAAKKNAGRHTGRHRRAKVLEHV